MQNVHQSKKRDLFSKSSSSTAARGAKGIRRKEPRGDDEPDDPEGFLAADIEYAAGHLSNDEQALVREGTDEILAAIGLVRLGGEV